MSIEAMRQARNAFVWNLNTDLDNIPACEQWANMLRKNIDALDKALADAELKWVGLTDDEVEDYWDWEDFQTGAGRSTIFEMVRHIDATLKRKNNE
jgi:hypothetical protein